MLSSCNSRTLVLFAVLLRPYAEGAHCLLLLCVLFVYFQAQLACALLLRKYLSFVAELPQLCESPGHLLMKDDIVDYLCL